MGKQDTYRAALENKKIPLLVLDNKWHQLFTKIDSTSQIEKLSEELNKLLREQGKMNNKAKDVRALKKKLMKDIVNLADEMEKSPDPKKEKKMDELRRLLLECNEKLDECRYEIKTIPEQMEEINYQLMLATMELCYSVLNENTDIIEAMVEKIARMRIELKKSEIIKEEMMDDNHKIYSYMHNIFGPEVMELFDLRYNPSDRNWAATEK